MYCFTKFLFISLFILFVSLPAFAQTSDLEFIKSLETQLFNTSYASQATAQRLARIEEIVMGQSMARDPDNVRIARLQALLGSNSKTSAPLLDNNSNNPPANMNVVPPEPTEYTEVPENYDPQVANDYKKYSVESPQSQNSSANSNPYASEGDEVEDYPAVSYIENKVFSKTYKGEDISKRLDRLEQNLFNKTKSDLSLSERLDALKVAVLGTTNVPLPQNNSNNDDDMISNNSMSPRYGSNFSSSFNSTGGYGVPGVNQNFYNKHYNNPQVPSDMQEEQTFPSMSQYQQNNVPSGQMSDESMSQITGRLEQQILGKDFQNDAINARLDRLEMKVFNRTSPNSTVENRIERLVAVSAADGSGDQSSMKQANRANKIRSGLNVGGMLFSILSGFLF